MKNPFQSIKWRLQLWHGLILVIVLAGFGFTALRLERGRQFRQIDDQLHDRLRGIMNIVRPPPGRPPRGDGRFGDGPRDGRPPGDRPRNHQPPEEARERFPMVDSFDLERVAARFDETDTNGFYYIIKSLDGKELARSANAPLRPIYDSTFPPPPQPNPVVDAPLDAGNSPEAIRLRPPGRPRIPPRTRGYFREVTGGAIQTAYRPENSDGFYVYVGRSIAPEVRELRLTTWKLSGVGAVVLLFGLAGGWWIASRAMRPVQDISTTAAKISGTDLSQRINVADTENELGQLAGVLNSTFSRLETSFGQQRRFTADAAHELRTPVTVMLTETQTTLKRERSAEEYRQTVEVCQRITQRMRRLIETLLELARLDAGQEQMKRIKFDLSGTVHECVELILPLADERNIKIHHDVVATECAGDSERLSQVVTNLLTNAVQYNKNGGIIRVKLERQENSAVLTVTDSGNGIAAEDLPRVFERFYRAEKSRSSGNAGLGLAICKSIVDAHGGTIEATSKEGEGATFTIRLPCA
jgi:two-component system OmpR family sensor kinase